jgi:6-phosphogluconolactonase
MTTNQTTTKQIEVLSDTAAVVQRALVLVLERIRMAIAQRGFCTLVLAGGSTPKPLYEKLAAESLPWDKIHIFWGDERYVPADHPDSNEGMARKAWLDHVAIPAENIHAMPTQAESPADAAAQHDAELQGFFQLTAAQVAAGEFPAFDVILLGMGDDGHTASLFPHTAALRVSDRLVTLGNKDGTPRITFTFPLINHARCVLFLVAGANKRPALAQVFSTQCDTQQYPSGRIAPVGELWWLLDQAAGAEMT